MGEDLKIYTLAISHHIGGENIVIHPAVLFDGKEAILVDCGYPQSLPALEDALWKVDLSFRAVSKLVITHHDHDHVGALAEIEEKYPHVELFCSDVQLPYVTGKRKSLRVQQAEDELLDASLPDCERDEIQAIRDYLLTIIPAKHATVLRCGEILPCCGGIEVVDTKGHMPGHISLYVQKLKTLIVGDALVVENGELTSGMPEAILNMPEALTSIENLLTYDIEKLICYHGGEYTQNVHDSLVRILKNSKV